MRKVTQQIVNAFLQGSSLVISNSYVRIGKTDVSLFLHNNRIAYYRTDLPKGERTIHISFAGWPTPTTKERLNGLSEALGKGRLFYTKKGDLYMGDKEIDSNLDHWYVI